MDSGKVKMDKEKRFDRKDENGGIRMDGKRN
jgi:hypothetical protein